MFPNSVSLQEPGTPASLVMQQLQASSFCDKLPFSATPAKAAPKGAFWLSGVTGIEPPIRNKGLEPGTIGTATDRNSGTCRLLEPWRSLSQVICLKGPELWLHQNHLGRSHIFVVTPTAETSASGVWVDLCP